MNGWHQVFEMIRFGKRELNHICSISSESKYPEKNLRINCISSGAIASRAAKAIGFIDEMIEQGSV